MVSKLRLRVLERVVDDLEAEAAEVDQKLQDDIEVQESIIRAEIGAGAILHVLGIRPVRLEDAAAGALRRLDRLQAMTQETGAAWTACVDRVLSGPGVLRHERREAVLQRVEEVRAAVRALIGRVDRSR